MESKNQLVMLMEKYQVENILRVNEYTEKFGLTLSMEDARVLAKSKNETLKEEQRVELGESILPKIILCFCDSNYIDQNNFVETIIRLQEIFFMYKNESMDELSDDELLDFMEKKINGECEGSLDYLETTVLDEFARNIRRNTRRYFGSYRDDEEGMENEL